MIRKIEQADAAKIEKLLNKISNFTSSEVEVAMELVNIAANNPTQKEYYLFVYEHEKKILGYHCTGKRPLTDGVFDLYWIVADPDSNIKGIGKNLLDHAEGFVKENKGRWFLAETSSKENYSKTRSFYLRNKFTIVAEINDFYSIGDHLIIFGKYFY